MGVLDSVRHVRGQSPLVFFGWLCAVAASFGCIALVLIPPDQRFAGFSLTLGALIVIGGAVFWLVVNHADKVVIGEHRRWQIEMLARFGERGQAFDVETLESIPQSLATPVERVPAFPADEDGEP